MAIPSLDPNDMFDNLSQRYYAAVQALSRTPFGRGNVIKVDIDEAAQKVFYTIPSTGQVAYDLESAFQLANSTLIGEVETFKRREFFPRGSFEEQVAKSRRYTNKYGAFQSIFDDIYKKVQRLSPEQLEELRLSGVDISKLENLQADIVTFSPQEGKLQQLVKSISKMEKEGPVKGIPIMDSKGVRILQFRLDSTPDSALDLYQANLLLGMTGHPISDPKIVKNLLYASDKAIDDFASMLEKQLKRERAFLSSRDVSLAGSELGDILESFGKEDRKTLTKEQLLERRKIKNRILIRDPQYDILRLFSGRDLDNPTLQAYYKIYFGDVNSPEQFLKNIIDLSVRKPEELSKVDEFLAKLKTAVGEFDVSYDPKKFKQFKSDGLEKFLKEYDFGDINPFARKMVATIFESTDKAFDGADLLNLKFLEHLGRFIQGKTSKLKKLIKAGDLTPQQLREGRLAIEENEYLANLIRRGDLGQITGRGNILVENLNKFLNVKNAFYAKEAFGEGLEDVVAVISKSSLKPDTKLAGQSTSLLLSGIGTPKDFVYADPVLVSFMPEAFADQQSINAVRANAARLMEELDEVIRSGRIPKKLKDNIDRAAGVDLGSLTGLEKQSASRSKEFAVEIQRLILSGANPKDHPLMASLIHNFYATQAFVEKKGLAYPVIPELFRFGIMTEQMNPQLTEGGFKTFSGKLGVLTEGGAMTSFDIATNTKVMKFRVDGHTMFIPNQAVGAYYHSLGGFDLDDKGLPRLITYEDSAGRKRLGSYIFRQPSGPEEIMFAVPQLDRKGIRSLFGRDYFKESLDQLIEESTDPDSEDFKVLQELKEILNLGESDAKLKAALSNEDKIESALVRMYERAAKNNRTGVIQLTERAAQKIFGKSPDGKSSPLMLTDLVEFKDGKYISIDPRFSSRGIYKQFLDEGVFDISESLVKAAKQFSINPELEKSLAKQLAHAERAGLSPAVRQQNMFKAIGKAISKGKISENEANALLESAASIMRNSAIENSKGFLGSYVNTSMVVGSTLEQYEQFLTKLGEDSDVTKFMMDNFRVGILPQETAIDISTTFSRSKLLMMESSRILAENAESIADEKLVGKALSKMIGNIGPDGTVPVDIEDLRRLMVEDLGRMFGFASNINIGEDDLKLKVDEQLLRYRFSEGDRATFLSQIVSGYEQFQATVSSKPELGLSSMIDETLEGKMGEYRDILAREDPDEILNLLLRDFGMSANHRFASVSKYTALGNQIRNYFEANRKAIIRNLGESPVLMLAEATSQERLLAESILEKNKDILESIFRVTSDQRAAFSNLDIANFELRSISVAQKVLSDISIALETRGTTGQGLFNALDQTGAKMGKLFDLAGMLRPLIEAGTDQYDDPNHQRIMDSWQAARQRRAINHALNLENARAKPGEATASRRAFEALKEGDEAFTREEMVSRAAKLIDSETDEEVKRILLSILDRSDEMDDELLRTQAGIDASILDAMVSESELTEDVIDELDRAGEGMSSEEFGEIDDETRRVLDDFERVLSGDAETSVEGRAKFKRIGESMSDIRSLWEDKIFRRGTIGIGALIIASFAYTSIKDRTYEDMSGPPLLPGGSAYESDYPKYRPQTADLRYQGYSSGTSYNISINGSQAELDRFNQEVSGLTNGDVNTTMYSGTPDLRNNLFDIIPNMI